MCLRSTFQPFLFIWRRFFAISSFKRTSFLKSYEFILVAPPICHHTNYSVINNIAQISFEIQFFYLVSANDGHGRKVLSSQRKNSYHWKFTHLYYHHCKISEVSKCFQFILFARYDPYQLFTGLLEKLRPRPILKNLFVCEKQTSLS